MKAEQRKELETNTLADKMGQVMQRVKTGQRRTFLVYVVIAAVVIIVLGVGYRMWTMSKQDTASDWVSLDDATGGDLRRLAENKTDTEAGKAASLQIAWSIYWELGIKRLASDPAGSVKWIDEAQKRYERLAEACKDDKIFEPQALLGMAVCEESRAIQVRTRLEKAVKLYGDVVDKYKDTAEGHYAQARLDQLRDKNGKIRPEATATYDELQRQMRVPDVQAPLQDLHPNMPDLFNKGEKDKKKDE